MDGDVGSSSLALQNSVDGHGEHQVAKLGLLLHFEDNNTVIAQLLSHSDDAEYAR